MDKTLKLYIGRVKELPEPNRSYLLNFKEQCDAAGTSESRTREYLRLLIEGAKLLNKDMKKSSAEDIDKALAAFRRRKKLKRSGNTWIETDEKLSETTITGFVISLKLFFKRLYRSDEYPACVKHLKVSQQKGLCVEAHDMLNYDEIVSMCENARTARGKALIWTWVETGARASELINIRRKDIKFYGDEAEVTIYSEKIARRKEKGQKTRINTIIYGAQYLGIWIDQLRPKPDDYIFVNIGNKGHGKQMTIGNLNSLLKDIAKRAGIKKRVWVHLGRHTAATILAKRGVNESAMRQYLGWSHKSDMPTHYSHMTKRDASDSVKSLVYGRKTSDNGNGETVIHECFKCGFRNLGKPEFCRGCGVDLKDADVEKELANRKRKAIIGEAVEEGAKEDETLRKALATYLEKKGF